MMMTNNDEITADNGYNTVGHSEAAIHCHRWWGCVHQAANTVLAQRASVTRTAREFISERTGRLLARRDGAVSKDTA